MSLRRWTVAAAAVLAAAFFLKPTYPGERPRYIGSQRSDLRNLVSQQEVYYHADRDVDSRPDSMYAARLGDLDFATSDGVTVTMVEATTVGGSASTRHRAVPERNGVVFGGRVSAMPATSSGVTPTEPGLVACDGR